MSLGRPAAEGDDTGDYEQVGAFALQSGSLLVAAAGNDSDRRLDFVSPVSAPGNAPSVLAVGAIDEDRHIAPFSNGGLLPNGGEVNLCAPGVEVLSAVTGGDYRTSSGTSMAAPHVAGVAALLAEADPSLRGRALWDALEARAQDIGLQPSAGGKGLVQAPKGSVGVA